MLRSLFVSLVILNLFGAFAALGGCKQAPSVCDDNSELRDGCSSIHDICAAIVAINDNDQYTMPGKHPQPVVMNTVLFNIVGTDQYFKLSNRGGATLSSEGALGDSTRVLMNDAWVYNHAVGDTVRFTSLRVERIFRIKPRH